MFLLPTCTLRDEKETQSPPTHTHKIQTNHMKGWGLVSSVTAVSKAMDKSNGRKGGRKGGRKKGGKAGGREGKGERMEGFLMALLSGGEDIVTCI